MVIPLGPDHVNLTMHSIESQRISLEAEICTTNTLLSLGNLVFSRPTVMR
jgi:hypothetical protein